jgi:hypothetical protein
MAHSGGLSSLLMIVTARTQVDTSFQRTSYGQNGVGHQQDFHEPNLRCLFNCQVTIQVQVILGLLLQQQDRLLYLQLFGLGLWVVLIHVFDSQASTKHKQRISDSVKIPVWRYLFGGIDCFHF